jgi:DNA-directed RNA polymerase specialized sigma24 family protein
MGETDRPTGQSGLPTQCLAAMALRENYYRSLFRLAALLMGDPTAAEEIAADALAALPSRLQPGGEPSADALRFLQQQVLIRSRGRRRRAAPAARRQSALSGPQLPAVLAGADPQPSLRPGDRGFAFLPVVRALQELPPRGREAVVLRLYLDLSDEQAAAMAGITEAVLRQQLIRAMRTLQDRLPAS